MASLVEIGTASAGEMAVFREWANAEGWNQGRSDVPAFRATDPGGFLVGRLGGQPVATVSAVRHGTGHGFLGFYITRPDLRGRGYGRRLWQAAMDRLAGRNVGLDGVVAQQENYRRSGFRRAWTHLRYEGTPPFDGPVPPDVMLVDGRSVPFERLADLDRRFFPAPRDAFLSLWTTLPEHSSLGAVRDGRLAGFAVARPAQHGTRIGPLYAESPGIALALLTGLTAPSPGEPVALDVPDVNPRAVRLAEDLGLRTTFECARMYTGPVPELDTDALWGNTTLELG